MNNNPAKATAPEQDDMLPEYDFTDGVRGKHFQVLREGYSVIIHHADGTITVKECESEAQYVKLDSDVQAYFPDSTAVNRALRGLIALIPQQVE